MTLKRIKATVSQNSSTKNCQGAKRRIHKINAPKKTKHGHWPVHSGAQEMDSGKISGFILVMTV